MMLPCLKETGGESPEDFPGCSLGVRSFGKEYPLLSWMAYPGMLTDGSHEAMTLLKQGFNVAPLLQEKADCISTMNCDEYWQLLDTGSASEELISFKYEDRGVAKL
ncbi:hypothetical protein BV392_11505 [Rhodovulum sulfidophilum]|nr:hypothetical protein BV392_11505 [Rhodovulum sulfidophilum]